MPGLLRWLAASLPALVAAADPTLPDWTKFGLIGMAVGAVVTLFVSGRVVPGGTYRAMERRCEASEQREREMHAKVEGEVLTVLGDAGREMGAVARELGRFVDRVDRGHTS